jgi:hypothetical protein
MVLKTCDLHGAELRLELDTHTLIILYLIVTVCHGDNGYANASEYHFTCAQSVFLTFMTQSAAVRFQGFVRTPPEYEKILPKHAANYFVK